ncbi:putative testis-expressed sequence 9 protein [Apostichopus japonicus]|uniref:Putative testis-expressed sequence 9 protein n=1 Tax=Stichopus japonicus TaxID=307972 RepID=A0A2G8KD26_STIJA|nr:putative testis-expressed sequence 9 protein [Apostichopus japonicus]
MYHGSPPSSGGGRRSAGREVTGATGGSNRDLLSREEEYMRLNAELEAKTATLIQEAEEVMREQESVLNHSFNRLELTSDLTEGENTALIFETEPPGVADDISKPSLIPAANLDKRPGSRGRPSTAGSRGAPGKATNKTNKRPKSRATSAASAAEDVAIPRQGVADFSLGDTISNIERRVEAGGPAEDFDGMDDVLPQAAEGMGSEATIRFLKAKLRVMQEELDSVSQECNQREESNAKLESKVKDLEDERGRLNRSHQSQVSQIDKYKKLAEEAKRKNDGLETQLSGLRKELETIKRSQKSSASTHSATEVRLNRALEEVEKYKSELQRAKLSSRESSEGDKRRTEQLLAENRRLEKQKNELMAGFKKQLKLIDVLKKQKMHIEAAKMLSFTEEEFVKALEWGS